MSTVIKLKKSSVNGASPDPLNLEYGELALNYTDGKLYFRTSTNELSYFSTTGGQQGSLDGLTDVTITSPTSGQVLKYDGTNWINAIESGGGSSLPDQTNNSGKLLTTNGTTASWITPALVAGVAAYTTDLITATEGQTIFNSNYTVGYINVYLNGIRLLDTIDYIATNGTSIILTTAAVLDDVIEVVNWENTPNFAYTRYSYTATAGQTIFAATYSIGTVDVYFNGIKLNLNTDYTATNGTNIILVNAASENDIVEIIAWQNITATSGVNLLPDQDGYSGYILSTDGTTAAWVQNTGGFSGSYTDLTDKPTLFSGAYADLTGKPTIPADVSDLTDTTNLLVHFSGAYADLTGKPTIPSSANDLSDVTITSPQSGQVLKYNGTAWINDTDATGGGGGGAGTGPVYTRYSYTATAGQTTFAATYSSATIDVYLNGIKLNPTVDYTANNNTSIILSFGADADDIIEILVWENVYNINWINTTTNINASAGDKLFIDCSSIAITVTLPTAPVIGDEIRIIDATGSSATNNITIARNGNNILGVAENLVIQTNRAAFGLVFYNAAQGWILMEK